MTINPHDSYVSLYHHRETIKEKDERIEELEPLIDRTIEWKESMPDFILKNFLRENYFPLSNLIYDMRKARGRRDEMSAIEMGGTADKATPEDAYTQGFRDATSAASKRIEELEQSVKNQIDARDTIHERIEELEAELAEANKKASQRGASYEPDWELNCDICGATPIVPATGMCGPCTFGEVDTAGGNW